MRTKMRELHELPSTEMVKSGLTCSTSTVYPKVCKHCDTRCGIKKFLAKKIVSQKLGQTFLISFCCK